MTLTIESPAQSPEAGILAATHDLDDQIARLRHYMRDLLKNYGAEVEEGKITMQLAADRYERVGKKLDILIGLRKRIAGR